MVGFPNSTRPPFEPIEPSYGTDLNQEYEVNRVKFGDGYSQRKVPGLNADPQKWSINWENIHDDDAETLRLFFKALRGVDLLEWTPYNQAVALKFSANRFRSRPTGYQTQSCSIELTQEFDL